MLVHNTYKSAQRALGVHKNIDLVHKWTLSVKYVIATNNWLTLTRWNR